MLVSQTTVTQLSCLLLAFCVVSSPVQTSCPEGQFFNAEANHCVWCPLPPARDGLPRELEWRHYFSVCRAHPSCCAHNPTSMGATTDEMRTTSGSFDSTKAPSLSESNVSKGDYANRNKSKSSSDVDTTEAFRFAAIFIGCVLCVVFIAGAIGLIFFCIILPSLKSRMHRGSSDIELGEPAGRESGQGSSSRGHGGVAFARESGGSHPPVLSQLNRPLPNPLPPDLHLVPDVDAGVRIDSSEGTCEAATQLHQLREGLLHQPNPTYAVGGGSGTEDDTYTYDSASEERNSLLSSDARDS